MIFLFTDFGVGGPYLGQMEFVIKNANPQAEVINLVADAPACNPRASAYLLASLIPEFSANSVFLCVVDPGVGGERLAVVLRADDRWFVGPDNGLLNTVARHASDLKWWIIEWRPEHMSASFHGRDLFAPIAARIDQSGDVTGLKSWCGPRLDHWPDDIDEIIYCDHYGNLVTGRRGTRVPVGKSIQCAGHTFSESRTFGDVSIGEPLWYVNSMGLIEIAVNQQRADQALGLSIGDRFTFC